MTHELKIMKRWFEDVQSGKKNFEIRRSDRDFKVGDLLLLKEYDHGKYTGREITREVEYIYKGDGTYGVSDMFWILGLKQEPCEDAIKREAVLNTLDTMDKALDENRTVESYKELLAECYKELPPVTPTAKESLVVGDAVSREAVKSALCELCGDKNSCPFVNGDCDDLNAINALPPVTPKQRTGHWVEIGDEPYDTWECDNCGFVIDGSGCVDPEEYRDIYKYCPNCGAKMEGDGE